MTKSQKYYLYDAKTEWSQESSDDMRKCKKELSLLRFYPRHLKRGKKNSQKTEVKSDLSNFPTDLSSAGENTIYM